MLAAGDAASGKTTLLRTWARGLAARHPPDDARLIIVDVRRGLHGAVPASHVAGYAADPEAVSRLIEQLAVVLRERMPPPGITPHELRSRTWWTGPEAYVVADDYELVSGGSQEPLAPLADFVPRAHEIGLHLVIARRTTGAGRTMRSDPLLAKIGGAGTCGLLLSGDPHEGMLVRGLRPARMRPGRGVLACGDKQPRLIQIALDDDGEAAS